MIAPLLLDSHGQGQAITDIGSRRAGRYLIREAHRLLCEYLPQMIDIGRLQWEIQQLLPAAFDALLTSRGLR